MEFLATIVVAFSVLRKTVAVIIIRRYYCFPHRYEKGEGWKSMFKKLFREIPVGAGIYAGLIYGFLCWKRPLRLLGHIRADLNEKNLLELNLGDWFSFGFMSGADAALDGKEKFVKRFFSR